MPIRQVHSRPVAVGELAEITSDNANGLHPVWDLFDRCAGWPSGAAPLEPDVPVLAPLFEGEPSRMVSRDTPGDTDKSPSYRDWTRWQPKHYCRSAISIRLEPKSLAGPVRQVK